MGNLGLPLEKPWGSLQETTGSHWEPMVPLQETVGLHWTPYSSPYSNHRSAFPKWTTANGDSDVVLIPTPLSSEKVFSYGSLTGQPD